MEKSIKYWHAMSDPAMLEQLGEFVKQTRLQQNKTQQQVATAAGINRSTMVQIEKGAGGTLLSLIQILRALEQLQIFEHFDLALDQHYKLHQHRILPLIKQMLLFLPLLGPLLCRL